MSGKSGGTKRGGKPTTKPTTKPTRKPTRKVSAKPRPGPGARRAQPAVVPRPLDFPIVALGSSAGGLEALEAFFDAMPADSGMAFVVVTHQHPGHISLLPELLGRHTAMAVVSVEEGIVLQPNRVHVTPPGKNVTIDGNKLRLTPLVRDGELHLPIDHFLRSLASECEDRAICVVLSGTGTDGTLGLREIKGHAGMAMVQDEASARYPGMPQSASATLLADYVLPPAQMPAQILAYIRGARGAGGVQGTDEPEGSEETLFNRAGRGIFALLRARTTHDFSGYKLSTMRRRIERRIRVQQLDKPAQYLRFLQSNPHEIDLLFRELLISVTSFFRDPAGFEAVKSALRKIVEGQPEGFSLRMWVPGCSTGEEGYSLGMIVSEIADDLKRRIDAQIFCTDLDSKAIDYARQALYPEGIVADVGPTRLARFFSREPSGYRIRKEIREMMVFAIQDVLKDPPFTKLDLISCRNLLIYLNPELQQRLIPLFQFALQPGRLLFLGTSETVGSFEGLFTAVDRRWKLYERKRASVSVGPAVALTVAPWPAGRTHLSSVAPGLTPAGGSTIASRVEKLLLERFAPPTLIINDRGDIAYIHGRTGAYLEPSAGEPRNNLFTMAREGLRIELPSAVRIANAEDREVVHNGIRVVSNGGPEMVNVIVRRIDDPESVRGLLRVTLEPAAAPETPAATGKRDRHSTRRHHLERELACTRDTLQGTVEELQTSNEELKSTNEELQSTNEELQSANEELETSREELQSLNEELQTVNAELQTKIDELSHSNDDMQNLLNSTEIATLFLDRDLRIQRFTSQAREVINLIPTDVGRPVGDLASHLRYDKLTEDARRVLVTLAPHEVDVQTKEGHWRLLRMLPYRTSRNIIDGIVVTLVDIDRLKRSEMLAATRAIADGIVQTVREPLLVLDVDRRISLANQAFLRVFQLAADEVERALLAEIGGGFLDVPGLSERLEEVATRGAPLQDLVIERDFPKIGPRRMLLNARRLEGVVPDAGQILLAFDDVTDRPAG